MRFRDYRSSTDVFQLHQKITEHICCTYTGGTVDISVHEKLKDDKLKELHKVTGGPWGGNYVNEEFLQLLEKLFGEDVVKQFMIENLEDALELIRTFEQHKRNQNLEEKMSIKFPAVLIENAKKKGWNEKRVIPMLLDKIEVKVDKVRIDTDLIRQCFQNTLRPMINLISSILDEQRMRNVSTLLLVGGQAESKFVQTELETRLKNKRFVIPNDCGLAVVKGAVLFGYNPQTIASRVARYTYGIGIAVPFNPKVHPSNKKVTTDMGELFPDMFWNIVSVDDDIPQDHMVQREGKAVNDWQKAITRKFYRSVKKDPCFTTDPSCELVGEIRIPLEQGLKAKENVIDEKFMFGGTEAIFEAVHRKTKNSTRFNLGLLQ